MTAPEPTPVVLLPNGNIAHKMPAWWREIGPDGKDYGNLPVLPKGAVRMVPAPQPDPDIRAQAIEVLARLHGCAEWDETQHDATAKRGQHAAIVRDIDALAEAGLLPTEPVGYVVLAKTDSAFHRGHKVYRVPSGIVPDREMVEHMLDDYRAGKQQGMEQMWHGVSEYTIGAVREVAE